MSPLRTELVRFQLSAAIPPGPCVVDDLADALLLSIFELTDNQSDPSVVRRTSDVGGRSPYRLQEYGGTSILWSKSFQPACIDQHASDRGRTYS